MTFIIPAPRLLPATIATLAALLLLKGGILSMAALTHGAKPDGSIVTVAHAAEAAKEHAKPSGEGAHSKPPPAAEHGASAKEHGAPAGEHGAPAAEQKSVIAAPPPVPEGPPPVSESERALLQELRARRQELEARAEAMTTRESVLVATEKKLSTRVTELQTLQASLEHLDAAQKQKEDAGWQGLVKVYETMKPKEAAAIFNDLAMPVLLPVLDRMKDSKAAAVMAAMNPDKARDVTAELAQLRTGHDASGPMPAKTKSPPGT
jgi:flagellar motility protein MotE (MotC chaperone)